MKSVLDKRGNISEVPGYFQIFLLISVFAGLTFIVLDKYLDTTETGSLATYTVANETGYVNQTGYTLALAATAPNFQHPVIIEVLNATDNTTIGAGNYTLTGNVLTNATATNWPSARITYTYDSTGTGVNAYNAINQSAQDLYDYGIGFLGIIILVTMVYLIIRIISNQNRR